MAVSNGGVIRSVGRPKGAKNKLSSVIAKSIAQMCKDKDVDPFEAMIDILANKRTQSLLRFHCAKELAQYIHPKLTAIKMSGDPDNPLIVYQEMSSEMRKARIDILLEKKRDGTFG